MQLTQNCSTSAFDPRIHTFLSLTTHLTARSTSHSVHFSLIRSVLQPFSPLCTHAPLSSRAIHPSILHVRTSGSIHSLPITPIIHPAPHTVSQPPPSTLILAPYLPKAHLNFWTFHLLLGVPNSRLQDICPPTPYIF